MTLLGELTLNIFVATPPQMAAQSVCDVFSEYITDILQPSDSK